MKHLIAFLVGFSCHSLAIADQRQVTTHQTGLPFLSAPQVEVTASDFPFFEDNIGDLIAKEGLVQIKVDIEVELGSERLVKDLSILQMNHETQNGRTLIDVQMLGKHEITVGEIMYTLQHRPSRPTLISIYLEAGVGESSMPTFRIKQQQDGGRPPIEHLIKVDVDYTNFRKPKPFVTVKSSED